MATIIPAWLPDLITLASFGGDWDLFLGGVYACYRRDFSPCNLTFQGDPISLRKRPYTLGKEASFWHLISEGRVEDDRLTDFRRCERIGWARAIIENANDEAVRQWENQRRGERNVCLWLECADYLVVLGRRTGYTLLLTGYTVSERQRVKLRREYESFLNTQQVVAPLKS